jgi:hypothetical protein
VAILVGVVLATALWFWSDQEPAPRGLDGGPLFDFTPGDVVRLEVRRALGDDVLVREDGRWRLEGDRADLVDGERMASILELLTGGDGFAVLPGTEPFERRFGFASEAAVELVFTLADGAQHRLALGDLAPVSDQIYASGAGRPGVFGVGGRFYQAAAQLPDNVRLQTLLPPLALADLDSLTLHRRDQSSLRFRADERRRWWLSARSAGDLVGLAGRYHARFEDRQQRHDGERWLLASHRRLADVVFRTTGTDVVGFVAPEQVTPAQLAELGLAPPYRGVTLHRGDQTWDLFLGESQPEQMVLARREGALVMTRDVALAPLEGFVSEFLELGALGFRLSVADSFRVDHPDRPWLWARRAPDPQRRLRDGESPWIAVLPTGWRFNFDARTTANHAHDLQVYLDRLAMIDLLDETDTTDDPLVGDRWRIGAYYDDAPSRVVWLGTQAASGRPVIWEPATGRLALVDEEILVTLRNLGSSLEWEP